MNKLCSKLLRPFFSAVSSVGVGNPHMDHEVELINADLKPVALLIPPKRKAIQHKIDDGSYVDIGQFPKKEDVVHWQQVAYTVARKDKVDEANKLYTLFYEGKTLDTLYNVDENAEMSPEALHTWIGKTLGYTQNDIDWFLGHKYQNPVIKKILLNTDTFRRYCRKEYLLNFSQNNFS